MSNDLTAPARTVRARRATVSPRVEIALTALASGSAATISQAAEQAKITRRGLGLALQKPAIRARMKELIEENLKAGSLRASSRMRELMEDADNSMVAFKASEYLLGTGAGIAPPVRTSTAVAINIAGDVRAGFVIDLSEGDRPRAVVGGGGSAGGPVIEGEAVEVDEA
jgi:hypothetical protein